MITLIIFLTWVLFFDKNNLVTHFRLHRQLNELKKDKRYYRQEIKKDSIAMQELMTNPMNLEKFAREKYLMKKDDEDLYVIIKK